MIEKTTSSIEDTQTIRRNEAQANWKKCFHQLADNKHVRWPTIEREREIQTDRQSRAET